MDKHGTPLEVTKVRQLLREMQEEGEEDGQALVKLLVVVGLLQDVYHQLVMERGGEITELEQRIIWRGQQLMDRVDTHSAGLRSLEKED